MASSELLRVRAFARGDPGREQVATAVNDYRARATPSQVETAVLLRAQSVETIRCCGVTMGESKRLLDRLKASRAKVTSESTDA